MMIVAAQFAQFVGAAFTGGATIAVWVNMSGDGGTIAARVIMACLAGAAGLEGFLDFCLGCFSYKIFQKLGLFSADPSKKCDDIAEDTRSTLGVRPCACLHVCQRCLLTLCCLQYFRRRLNEAAKSYVRNGWLIQLGLFACLYG